MKTSELSGAALDWAVAQAEGLEVRLLNGGTEMVLLDGDWWYPSESWAQGGPIIEREGICLKYEVDPYMRWTATWRKIEMTTTLYSASPLVAAMRCYVASKLGEEVEIPEALCTEKIEA